MIIGHLPAGYIASTFLSSKLTVIGVARKWLMWAGMFGAIAPDLDMLYFHLVDQRQHHHHTYWTHYPVVWGAALIASMAWLGWAKRSHPAAIAVMFSLNGFIHLLLDTIVGDIWWLAPFVDQRFSLFTVPALYQPWWLNFVLHWSFALELGLLAWAIYLRRVKWR